MQPTANEIISLLEPKSSDIILDISSGTGEPGLSIAPMLTSGKVIITDLSDDMLNYCPRKCLEKGVKDGKDPR